MFWFSRASQDSFLTCAPVIPLRRIRIWMRDGETFDLTADRIEDMGKFRAYRNGRKIADFGYGVRWWMEVEGDETSGQKPEAQSCTAPTPSA